MTVELEPRSDGHWHFTLGPVEKWIVGLAATALLGGCGWFVNSVTSRLDKLGDAQVELAKQQAVANQQLTTLNLQLADVPNLTRQMAEMKVRVDRHDEDLRELRGTRNLK